MKVSQRIQDLAESGTIAVSNKVAALRAEGIDVVSLGAGEPDFDTPDHIKQAAHAALDRGETKYAKPASGVAELKSAVIDKLARENNLTYAPDQIIATIGGKEGLYLAFATLLDPGDEVIDDAEVTWLFEALAPLSEAWLDQVNSDFFGLFLPTWVIAAASVWHRR